MLHLKEGLGKCGYNKIPLRHLYVIYRSQSQPSYHAKYLQHGLQSQDVGQHYILHHCKPVQELPVKQAHYQCVIRNKHIYENIL